MRTSPLDPKLAAFFLIMGLLGAVITGLMLHRINSPGSLNFFGRLRPTPPPTGWTDCDRCGYPPLIEPICYINSIHVQFNDNQQFGIVCPRLRDLRDNSKPKLLTGDERGSTNNTCVSIEDYEYMFGVEIPGVRYVKEKGKLMKEVPIPGKDRDRAWRSIWESEFGKIRVTQSVEIVVGEQTRLYDTALVRYHIWNRDKVPHTVGLRFLLDPQAGASKGLPFYVPPMVQNGVEVKPAHFLDDREIFQQRNIPDFIQAAECNSLDDPNGVIAYLGLKIKGAEPMEKLVVCKWPVGNVARWGGTGKEGDWSYEPLDKKQAKKEPCVVLYWARSEMKPDEHRQLAFTYGLGRALGNEDPEVKCTIGGKMRLFVQRASLWKPFTAVAYIKDATPGQTVVLALPKGLTLRPGCNAVQTVPPPGPTGISQVTWQLQAWESGAFIIEATAPGIGIATEKVQVNRASICEL